MSHRPMHHGVKPIRGLNEDPEVPDEPGSSRKSKTDSVFGRLFNKEPQQPTVAELTELGKKGGRMDEGDGDPVGDSPDLPLGFVFLGQFVDHDITLDETSALGQVTDPRDVINVRTPRLELDSVYAKGPDEDPPGRKMYDPADPAKLRVGTPANPDDLPRVDSGPDAGLAIIGDPRNDEHLVINQLHVAFLKFHNAVVDHLRSGGGAGGDAFAEARRLVRWHYQWIVLHDFLPRIAGREVVDDVLRNGRKHYRVNPNHEPYIPVEFSVAAYRYGHSQVRARLRINGQHTDVPVFSDEMRGFEPIPTDKVVDWVNFFDRNGASAQRARKIDAKLPGPLFDLPFVPSGDVSSLAARNLLRGKTFELISGQKAAQRMHVDKLSDAELDLAGTGLEDRTPLWYYILKEAEVRQGGDRLGEMGGRIVAEVLIGLLQEDPESYLSAAPSFTPTLPGATAGDFTVVDLLDFAGV